MNPVLLDNNLYHISTSPILNTNTIYKQYPNLGWEVGTNELGEPITFEVGGHKPEGLWYAFGDSWLKFSGNHYNKTKYLYLLDIDRSNFLKLSSSLDIEQFNSKYSVNSDDKIIDWLKVSEEYDGIELYPYDLALSDLYWYISFDVPSGCLWNLNKLLNFQLIQTIE